jgi:hypothetical protein
MGCNVLEISQFVEWLGSNEVSPQTLRLLGARKTSTPATPVLIVCFQQGKTDSGSLLIRSMIGEMTRIPAPNSSLAKGGAFVQSLGISNDVTSGPGTGQTSQQNFATPEQSRKWSGPLH